MNTTRLASLALAFTMIACGDGPLFAPLPPGAQLRTLTRLGPWGASGFDDARRTVITDAATWQATWATIHQGYSPQPPLPPVDFGENVVLLAAMGSRPSSGYSIRIENVADDAGVRYVQVLSETPGGSCVTLTVMTQPVDAVVVPVARDLSIRFVEGRTTHDCN